MSGAPLVLDALVRQALRVVWVFWIVAELGAKTLAARHKATAAIRDDRGSFVAIILGFLAAMGLALGARWAGIGLVPAWVAWPGFLIMVLGIALRAWSIILLGRFFSARVELQPDHRLVCAGPYRYARHPAYGGYMLTFIGFGLVLGSWVSAAILGLILRLVLGYRVGVEESLLLSGLGEDYRAYMARTGRFVPWWGAGR